MTIPSLAVSLLSSTSSSSALVPAPRAKQGREETEEGAPAAKRMKREASPSPFTQDIWEIIYDYVHRFPLYAGQNMAQLWMQVKPQVVPLAQLSPIDGTLDLTTLVLQQVGPKIPCPTSLNENQIHFLQFRDKKVNAFFNHYCEILDSYASALPALERAPFQAAQKELSELHAQLRSSSALLCCSTAPSPILPSDTCPYNLWPFSLKEKLQTTAKKVNSLLQGILSEHCLNHRQNLATWNPKGREIEHILFGLSFGEGSLSRHTDPDNYMLSLFAKNRSLLEQMSQLPAFLPFLATANCYDALSSRNYSFLHWVAQHPKQEIREWLFSPFHSTESATDYFLWEVPFLRGDGEAYTEVSKCLQTAFQPSLDAVAITWHPSLLEQTLSSHFFLYYQTKFNGRLWPTVFHDVLNIQTLDEGVGFATPSPVRTDLWPQVWQLFERTFCQTPDDFLCALSILESRTPECNIDEQPAARQWSIADLAIYHRRKDILAQLAGWVFDHQIFDKSLQTVSFQRIFSADTALLAARCEAFDVLKWMFSHPREEIRNLFFYRVPTTGFSVVEIWEQQLKTRRSLSSDVQQEPL